MTVENDCTEPNRSQCPRLCIEFCNKHEENEARLRQMGYDLDELERDNPYNQWMYNE
jgi:hypothetical protein